jgi:hypothetical protein
MSEPNNVGASTDTGIDTGIDTVDATSKTIRTPAEQIAKLAARRVASVRIKTKGKPRVGGPFEALKNNILETFEGSKIFCQEIAELFDIIKIPSEAEAETMDSDLKSDFAKLETKKKILNGLGASVAELTQDINAFQQYVFRKFVRPSRAQVAKLYFQHDELVTRLHNLQKFCVGVTSAAWKPPRPETNPNKDEMHVPQEMYHSEETPGGDPAEELSALTALAEEDEPVPAAADTVSPERVIMDDEDNFEKCETFSGTRKGWEFKVGSQGVGYYKTRQ